MPHRRPHNVADRAPASVDTQVARLLDDYLYPVLRPGAGQHLARILRQRGLLAPLNPKGPT